MDIYELVNKYIEAGYSEEDAIPKVAQDIILLKIGNSKYHKNITVKGGVVMHNISKDMRRATRDMDIDFIKYSLEDKSIRNFIKELNNTDDGIKIKITGKIEPLHHQDYDGKRVYITLTDKNHYSISSKLDIGVHKYFDIKQDEYYFDFNIIEESVSLLINSKEQIMVEKLKSLLKFGITSTRFKDIFDFYYLIIYGELNMVIININGAINSGKSTVSKILAQHLKSSCFIEVDDLLSDEEQSVLGLNRKEGWQERIKRLQRIIEAEKRNRQYENIVFAYPMTGKLFNEWKNWEDKNTKFINITLAPPMEICIGNLLLFCARKIHAPSL